MGKTKTVSHPFPGAYFTLSDTSQVHNCKLSSDHGEIVISDHTHISMTSIMEVKSNTSSSPESEFVSQHFPLTLNFIVMIYHLVWSVCYYAHNKMRPNRVLSVVGTAYTIINVHLMLKTLCY